MASNKTDKRKGQLLGNKDIKLSFLSKEIIVTPETGETECRLSCKMNFLYMEKYLKLSDKLKNKVVEGLLPTATLKYTKPTVHHFINNGDVITSIIESNFEEGTFFEVFSVSAKCKPQEGEIFDEVKGRMIAESKAKVKAYKKGEKLCARLGEVFKQLFYYFEESKGFMTRNAEKEAIRYSKIGCLKEKR